MNELKAIVPVDEHVDCASVASRNTYVTVAR